MSKKLYSLKDVTKAVNHWSMVKLSEAEVLYYLKTICEQSEDIPNFPHDRILKIIYLTQDDIEKNKEELNKWRNKKWIVQSIFEL